MTRPQNEIEQAAHPAAAPQTACGNATARAPEAESCAGGLLLRTAECLTALLHSPTIRAGLNESRYKVLDALRRRGSGLCSQTELATHLLQSESNLSTLLERMRQDGLISRVRSETDRRVTQIALSAAGREALTRADQSRARAAAPILDVLDERGERDFCDTLRLLVKKLERTLGIANRAPARTIVDGAQRPPAPLRRDPAGGGLPVEIGSTTTDGATP